MTDCQSVQTGTITGFGAANSEWKAVKRAIKDAKSKGKEVCIGGSCGAPGSRCTYKLGTMTVEIKQDLDPNTPTYAAVVQSDGRCKCE